jgi:ribosomal protein L18
MEGVGGEIGSHSMPDANLETTAESLKMCPPLRRNNLAYNETPTKGELMNKLAVTKTAVRLAVGFSVSYVTSQVIKNNVVPETTVQKIEVIVAAIAIGDLICKRVEKHVDQVIDDAVKKWNEK